LSGAKLMAGEIGAIAADGLTLYCTVQAGNKNNWWTGSGNTFEAFNSAHYAAEYGTTALTELTGSGGTYTANFPTAITSADEYTVVTRQKAGASPAVTDTVLAIQTLTWNGSAMVTQVNLAVNVSEIAGQTANAAGAVTFPGSIASPTNITGGTITTVSGNIGGNVTGNVGGNIGGITGVSLPSSVPSLAAIQGGLPTDSSIAADIQTGLTAQGYTTTRAGYLDTLNGIVAAIWAAATRTLTSFSDSAGVTTLLSRITGAVAPQSGDAYARLGAPAGASTAADISAIETKLGSPAGASVSADIATANSALSLSLSLIGQNQGVRNQMYDGSGNLLSADICAYDTAAHAATNDGATGLVHKWNLALTYSGGAQATQSLSQVS
jgi:hypothetical protein